MCIYLTKAAALLESVQGAAEETRDLLSDCEGLAEDASAAAESHADNVEDCAGDQCREAVAARAAADTMEQLHNQIQAAVSAADEAVNGAEFGVDRIEESCETLEHAPV